MDTHKNSSEHHESADLPVSLFEVDMALKEAGLVHNMASSMSDTFAGLEEVADITDSSIPEAEDIAEFSMMAEDDQFADKIAKSLFVMLTQALGNAKEVTFTQAMQTLSALPKAQQLIKSNPRFAEKSFEVLSRAFAEAIRTEQRDGVLPEIGDPLTASITGDLRNLLKERFQK